MARKIRIDIAKRVVPHSPGCEAMMWYYHFESAGGERGDQDSCLR